MRFSIKVKYGLQALLELAANYDKKTLKIGEMANKQKIPIRYLEQLLLVLKRRDLVKSVRGKSGGYMLLKRPFEITMLDVVLAFEGAMEFCACSSKVKKKNIVCEVLTEIESCVKEKLSSITLDDMLARDEKSKKLHTYNI
ncbi:hypothetical protein A3J90_07495 [candidate division WOR-1 bacterium RIFOXYC2_FULL_37_10]|uniref:Rrf2 family transcriptional regulator n=1 Tax=candidate division WOR-1 bacterium RIFOXYB2_FULL_37_13 TaxID=1802579 RepID=A0A1F4SHK0_UNCSA|nr:MAG: hypothetical protein A2246_00380 [candidate division WOR-1 bacterium RIFOXYA2_FULL_37_7]OGC19916.1 MAG: hypothetical protein A2310_08800 [candidate division WOR-1 bacterium RIFOXYB2_FULL_37_13]OGC36999.1 MAG: hypothetical protein A3J90_07495 [candidate division WOR-1 bacterium RIFOXYC2_FULL_37_10]